jgi:FMN phosphatase YigB (HAD superfamily)
MKGRNPSAKLILLTTAPKVWAERVLAYLGIAEYFEDLYTGEKFGQKDEIFRIIAGRYQNATSIGDQIETDILPARAVGIKGIRVAVSGDLPDILNKIK